MVFITCQKYCSVHTRRHIWYGNKLKVTEDTFKHILRSAFSETTANFRQLLIHFSSPGNVSNFANPRIGCKLTWIRILWPSLVSKWTLYYGCSSTLMQWRIASKRSLANGTLREKLFPTHQSMQHRKSPESIHYFPLLLPHLVEAFCIN